MEREGLTVQRLADPSAIEKAELVRVTGLSMRQVKAPTHASCIYSQLESFSSTLSPEIPMCILSSP